MYYTSLSEAGVLGANGESPYHGGFLTAGPILTSPDGATVLLGSGVTFQAPDLTFASPLSNPIVDAVWLPATLATLREINGIAQVQTWQGAQNLAGATVRQFNGKPVRLIKAGENLWTITLVQGVPRFILLDEDLNAAYTSPSVPAAPVALTVNGWSVDSVSLSWQNNSEDDVGFVVEFRETGGTWEIAYQSDSGVTTAIVTGLKAATGYEFRVAATVETLKSVPSSIVSTTTLTEPGQPVGEPYGLRITRVYSNSITLEWSDNAANETGFRILRSTTAAGATLTLNAPANARSFTDTSVAANTTYYYRVQAVNGEITGDMSAQVNARTLAAAAAPTAPTIGSVIALGATSVEVKWTDNSTNEDRFVIERSIDFINWTAVAQLSYNAESFVDGTAGPGTVYRYRVRASNAIGTAVSFSLNVQTPKLGGDFLNMSARATGIHYFAFTTPNRIERYDASARAWLPAIPLQATATALHADEAGVYVAEKRLVLRIDPIDGAQTTLFKSPNDVTGIVTAGNILLASGYGDQTTMDRRTGMQMATFSHFQVGGGLSGASEMRRVFFDPQPEV